MKTVRSVQPIIRKVIGHSHLFRVMSSSIPESESQTRRIATAAPTAAEDVVVHKIDNKRVIVLNRPKAHNALNLSMIRKIYPKLKKYNEDTNEVKLVIIKGEGEKAFCAGGDVRALSESSKAPSNFAKEFFTEEYSLNYLIGTMKIPYVALINGITMGGGVGLSVHGTFRVATEKTMFAMPETALGLFPDVGGSYFLPRLDGKLGTFLALTGHRLIGRDVLEAGIATHFVNSSLIKDLEKQLTLMKSDSITEDSVGLILSDFQLQSSKNNAKPHEYSLKPLINKINQIFNGDTVEEIANRLKKDGSSWALKQLEVMSKMSPTSLKMTLHQMKMGAKLDLKHCLQMEYRMAQHFMADHDFHEGVRAVLIHKTNDPKWKPDSLDKVTDEKIQLYFSSLPKDQELVLD